MLLIIQKTIKVKWISSWIYASNVRPRSTEAWTVVSIMYLQTKFSRITITGLNQTERRNFREVTTILMVYLDLPIHFNYFKDFVLLENRHLICYTIFASCIPNKDSYTYIMEQLGTEATSTPEKIERHKKEQLLISRQTKIEHLLTEAGKRVQCHLINIGM